MLASVELKSLISATFVAQVAAFGKIIIYHKYGS
jgi:hypothetical protein